MPLSTSRSHISCALDAGTVMMPICTFTLRQAAELGYREDRLALEFGRLFAQVERGDYIEPVCLEAAVVEQRLAEAAGADYHGIIYIIIAEESFKLRDKILDIVADLRFAGRADAREILANLNIIELKRFGDSCSGYIFRRILRSPWI